MLDRNWRVGRLELDIVTKKGDTVAFVEVKTRQCGVQAASETLRRGQRQRIRRAAGAWMRQHPGVGMEFRFDLVAVEFDGSGGAPRIEHIPGAFYGDG